MIAILAAALSVALAAVPAAISADLAPLVPRAAMRLNAWQARAEAALDAGAAEVWVLGGNWSGKTRYLGYAGVKRAMRAGAGELVYFCCQDHGVQRDTIQPEVVRYIAPYEYRRRLNGRPMVIDYNGRIDRAWLRRVPPWPDAGPAGIIQFRSYKEGSSAFQGPKIRFAACDELTGESEGHIRTYKELRRAAAGGGQLLFTVTPVWGPTPIIRDVLRRAADGEPGLVVIYASTSENAENLAPNAIERLATGLTEREIEVRLHGRPISLVGTPFVPAEVLDAIEVVEPIRVEEIEGVPVAFFEEPDAGARYALGADFAEGVGRDRGAFALYRVGWDRPTAMAAFAVADAPPEAIAGAASTVAFRYKGRDRSALANPEVNGPGLVGLKVFRDRGVRLMVRPGSEDGAPPPQRFGYRTGRETRDFLLRGFREHLGNGSTLVRARQVKEALDVFIWKTKTYEAASGFLDDEVVAAALGDFCASTVPAPAAPAARPSNRPPQTAEEHLARRRRRPFA